MTDSAFPGLSEAHAVRFAEIALGHVTREYPNVITHFLNGPEDARTPRAMHPIFFGSLDWHSCVHGHWLLARTLRLFPGSPVADRIRALFADSYTPEKVAGELAYFQRPNTGTFERPYGWAWYLLLAAELRRTGMGAVGTAWATALAPLTAEIVGRLKAYLPKATYPVRTGLHINTAFALTLSMAYARRRGDDGLADLIAQTARAWYGGDADAQVWEPSGTDFLSPVLTAAVAMAAVLPRAEFRAWFARLLPGVADGQPRTLFTPATVSDRSDGTIAHLDGLNLSRAWCWRAIAAQLDPADPVAVQARAAADVHLADALPHLESDYMGEHWLASFAVLALDGV
ncbi:DUF2891 domain-containing protein [Nitrospirillum amazonense]|uniref:DUF2891 family protein n=1 Tax=Nitrospirillum amazonense TaxID=28077 RepID=A0A560JE43_9PROT|nr:DUF2891 domain-containing protein [Nitrospirillum amazonense]MDG3439964.1 DUF2891 domain-containing protein [Nitrospirillum amazonense]TWB68779.1 DUF2891 family protein [Nitrospirillum amazonense]